MVRNRRDARNGKEEEANVLLRKSNFARQRDQSSDIGYRSAYNFVAPYIIPRTSRAKLLASASTLCTIIYKASLLLPGISFKLVIDTVSSTTLSNSEKATRAAFSVSLYFIGRLGAAIFSTLQTITYDRLSEDISRRFGARTYEHLLLLDMQYHTKVSPGKSFEILNRGIGSMSLLLRVVILQLGPTLLELVVITYIFARIGTMVS